MQFSAYRLSILSHMSEPSYVQALAAGSSLETRKSQVGVEGRDWGPSENPLNIRFFTTNVIFTSSPMCSSLCEGKLLFLLYFILACLSLITRMRLTAPMCCGDNAQHHTRGLAWCGKNVCNKYATSQDTEERTQQWPPRVMMSSF